VPAAFVTGGSGFVGANLVRALLARGWTVRALARGAAENLDGLPVDRVSGDLFSPHLADALRGCDVLFHVAAFYSLRRRDAADVMRANVGGTQAILAAAKAAGVPRVVYTSSVAAIGVRADGRPADETYQSPPEKLVGVYKQSKFHAEEAARAAVRDGLDVVIVNPSTPIGPWDRKPTPTGEIIVRFATGRMPGYVETGLNVVDVADVVRGHLLAYERGVTGERYILGGENLDLLALLERLAPLVGRPAPRLRIPYPVALGYAAVAESLAMLRGVQPDVEVEAVRMSRQRMFYDIAKAREILGYAPGPIAPALEAAVAWFREHGMFTSP
jgi:dihydroflavonol-4-reductase